MYIIYIIIITTSITLKLFYKLIDEYWYIYFVDTFS